MTLLGWQTKRKAFRAQFPQEVNYNIGKWKEILLYFERETTSLSFATLQLFVMLSNWQKLKKCRQIVLLLVFVCLHFLQHFFFFFFSLFACDKNAIMLVIKAFSNATFSNLRKSEKCQFKSTISIKNIAQI